MANITKNQINKIDRMAGLAFQNVLRLHFDAIRLYKMNSYSSALALSVLSMEELSKAINLEDMGWHALVDGIPIQDQWNFQEKYFYNHKLKQLGFASRVTAHSVMSKKAIRAVMESKERAVLDACQNAYNKAVEDSVEPETIEMLKKNLEKAKTKFDGVYIKAMPTSSLWRIAESGELEKIKQDALYVGISDNKNPTMSGSRIKNPLMISPKKPEKYITLVNDFLLDLAVGELGGWYGVDAENIKKQLTRLLVYRLSRSWLKRGKLGKGALRLYPNIEIEDD